MKIRWDSQRCYGCRACELACSYHRYKAFSPGGGSIRVHRDHRNGKIRWERGETCDLCLGEEEFLCVKYCTYRALEIGEVKGKIENR